MQNVLKYAALLIVLLQALPLHAEEKVDVRVVDKTYPVSSRNRKKPNWSPQTAPKLKGKSEYTTKMVVLENEYLRLEVLPELGGRLVRAVYKPTDKQMFWEHDRIDDGVSWSMGGCRWSFPFWEHGRHFDETAGYVIRRNDDGSVTLAMDMRFEKFLNPAETKRYGRATNLRLVQEITLAPGEMRYTWTGRVDNPLPIRHGFKLWYLMRQPATEGLKVILPTRATAPHGGGSLKEWNRDQEIGTMQDSRFSVGMRYDFAGWYSPKRKLNILRIQDHRIAPGAKQVLYRPSARGYVEMWGGNHEVFEETGRILPAFGGYEIKTTVLAATGIGPANFATEDMGLRFEKSGGSWKLQLTPCRAIEKFRFSVKTEAGKTVAGSEEATSVQPGECYTAKFETGAEKLLLTINDGEAALVTQQFPLDPGPMPTEQFKFVQACIRSTGPISKGLHAEGADLITEHGLTLWRGKKMFRETIEKAADPQKLLHASRRLMRVSRNDPAVKTGLEKVLDLKPDHPPANLYMGMWLMEADKPQQADKYLAKAAETPGGKYLLALRAVGKGEHAKAVKLLADLTPAPAGKPFDDSTSPLLQKGSYYAYTQPTLLLAIALRKQGDKQQAEKVLKKLIARDPALIEAHLLLDNADQIKTLSANNPAGLAVAKDNLQALQKGQWRGIGRP